MLKYVQLRQLQGLMTIHARKDWWVKKYALTLPFSMHYLCVHLLGFYSFAVNYYTQKKEDLKDDFIIVGIKEQKTVQ